MNLPRPPEPLVRLAYLALCWGVVFGALYYFYPRAMTPGELQALQCTNLPDLFGPCNH